MSHSLKTISILFMLLLSLTSCKDNKKNDIDLPCFQNAYDINQGYSEELKVKYLGFKLKMSFPASQVIDFYKTHFKNLGYISYSKDGYGKSEWEKFNDKTGAWEGSEEPPSRYISTWVDKNKKIRIVLVLLYKTSSSKQKDILQIELKAFDYFDFSN